MIPFLVLTVLAFIVGAVNVAPLPRPVSEAGRVTVNALMVVALALVASVTGLTIADKETPPILIQALTWTMTAFLGDQSSRLLERRRTPPGDQ